MDTRSDSGHAVGRRLERDAHEIGRRSSIALQPRQRRGQERSLEQTLELGWELIAMVPESALTMIDRKTLEKYHPNYRKK